MRQRTIILAAILGTASVAVIYFAVVRRSDVHGRVLTHGSAAPIAGATVTLDCMDATLHGYRSLFKIETTTDADGGYRFSRDRVGGCRHVDVKATARGHLSPWDSTLEYALIDRPMENDPKKIWLVDERDAVRLNLEGLLERSKIPAPSSTPIPDDDYSVIAIPFRESKRYARSARDFDWIRTNYCDRMREHWERTPEQSQTKLLQAGDVGDYDNDVVRFCAGSGIP